MKKLTILVAVCALPLGGCATTGFAPPSVPVRYADGTTLSGECKKPSTGRSTQPLAIQRDVSGALRYIEAHISTYDCSAREAANGRQGFEVPSFLVTTAAMTAAAFGAGTDTAIGASAANSVFSSGKAYYDPKQKSVIYGHAVDALGCIRTEALGIPSFAAINEASEQVKTQRAALHNIKLLDGTPAASRVTVTTDEQYFGMVADAVDRVKGILTTRLSNVGTFDPKGMADEFAANAAEILAKEKEKKDATPADDPTGTKSLFLRAPIAPALVQFDLAVLRPRLQQCIWRAKV